MSKQDNRRSSDKPVHVVAHSLFFYWWPVWLLSALLALMTYVSGVSFKTELADQSAVILRSAAPGTLFTLLLGVIILINTARIRRIVLLIGLPCLFVLSGLGLWFGWVEVVSSGFLLCSFSRHIEIRTNTSTSSHEQIWKIDVRRRPARITRPNLASSSNVEPA